MTIIKKTSVLIGSAAVALGVVGVGVAGASIPTPQCTASSLDVVAHERRSPNVADQLFQVEFEAKPGTACTMRGTLGDLVFHDPSGNPLPIGVVSPDPAGAEAAVLVPGSPKVVYIASRKGTGQGYPVASATFTLPSTAASDRTVTVAWPNSLSGPARLGYVGDFFG
ncbi:hypothetical protein ACFFQW_33160 [Umezawaea endophytica]|uniref:DUF4232 domain-containing protein n=1 Tax=Umezawaea endophytica TaxID=1654476 RepID=A0A9X2VWZ6_9PSEU|nr:hypothetical protein [Umezawaea endophytica]MCS7484220.1 hypothetical protein [Umezawaea endophytica]